MIRELVRKIKGMVYKLRRRQRKNLEEELDNAFVEAERRIDFANHFRVNYNLLVARYYRFLEVDLPSNRGRDIDVITYLDMIVVQLRSMCIESPQNRRNYTVQNLLEQSGRSDLANKIDEMLEERFDPDSSFDISIREALKLLADKFICHYDKADDKEWILCEKIEKQLRSPLDRVNLKYIMKTLMDCVAEVP